MIPDVTVNPSPNGLPMAKTGSPTRTSPESPRTAGLSDSTGRSARITARSFPPSIPVTSAVAVVPSRSSTTMREAPSTTWRLVRMCPSRSITMPLPVPCASTRICAIEGMT